MAGVVGRVFCGDHDCMVLRYVRASGMLALVVADITNHSHESCESPQPIYFFVTCSATLFPDKQIWLLLAGLGLTGSDDLWGSTYLVCCRLSHVDCPVLSLLWDLGSIYWCPAGDDRSTNFALSGRLFCFAYGSREYGILGGSSGQGDR
jgi:hypothetical protein